MNPSRVPVSDLASPTLDGLHDELTSHSQAMPMTCDVSTRSPGTIAIARVVSNLDGAVTTSLCPAVNLVSKSQTDSTLDSGGRLAVNVLHERQCTVERIVSVDVPEANVLHEKQPTVERIVCMNPSELSNFCSAVKPPMETSSTEDDSASTLFPPPFPPARPSFSDSENENPCSPRLRRDDGVDPDSMLRAPMKPVRVRSLSLSALNPGKTRRRLNFDQL